MTNPAITPATTLKALQLFQQGQQLHMAKKPAQAAEAFSKANALLPDHPGILVAYGQLAEEVEDWNATEKIYRRIGALRPNSNFEGKLALSLFKLDRYAEAIPLMRTHLARHPNDPDMLLPLGLALCKEKNWDAALACGKQLEAVRPDDKSMDIILNSLFNLGRRDELDALIESALARHPESPWVQSLYGVHFMKCGDLRRGFSFPLAVRWRYERKNPDYAMAPADWWDGQPFDGTLLVRGEQGLGEEILAASMFNDLVRMGQRCVIDCEPRLLPLFRRSFPTLEFVARFEGNLDRIAASGVRYRRIQSLDLAHFFRRNEVLEPQSPWLHADTAMMDALRARYRREYPGKKIAGISWKSSREFVGGPGKSIALTDLAALLRLPDYTWFNVQYGDIAADLDAVAALDITPPRVDSAIDATNDIDLLAAQLLAFDTVVSTSNTTAHLAGALGVKCHLLLPKTRPVLWYWGYDGAGTPWYPSITIHRNAREDDWQDLAAAVAGTLTP